MKKFILGLIVLAILEIACSLYLTIWREFFWNAIAAKKEMLFIQQIGIFTIVALFLCFITGYSGYLINLATIHWRTILNSRFSNRKKHTNKIENLEQRVQEDCRDYPDLMLSIVYGAIKAFFYILVFSISILSNFNGHYLLLLIIYGIIGTWLTKKVAYPLINLNYKTQQAEASYRKNLTQLNFIKCILLMGLMARKQKYLSYLQSFYSQIGAVIPLLLIAPEYFTTAMTVGLLMRFNSAAGTLLDNLSYGVTSFGSINKLLSCKTRLKGAGIL